MGAKPLKKLLGFFIVGFPYRFEGYDFPLFFLFLINISRCTKIKQVRSSFCCAYEQHSETPIIASYILFFGISWRTQWSHRSAWPTLRAYRFVIKLGLGIAASHRCLIVHVISKSIQKSIKLYVRRYEVVWYCT